MADPFPPPGPLDTLTGYPLSAQENSTGLLAPYSVGWSISLISYGLMLSSLCRYVQTSYSRDSRRRKALVWIVVLLNTAITAQVLENSVHWTTVQKRSTADLEHYRKWGVVGPVLSGVLALLVQGLFANRATKLFKRKASKWIFLTLITLGMVVAVAGAMTQGVLADLWRLEEAAPLTIQMSSGIWLWASAIVDLLNTGTLCVLLRGRVTNFNSTTDGLLKALIVLAIETASYTTVLALAGAVLSVSFIGRISNSNADIAAACWIPLPSLYALSLFTTLASRDRIVSRLNEGGIQVELNIDVAIDDGRENWPSRQSLVVAGTSVATGRPRPSRRGSKV